MSFNSAASAVIELAANRLLAQLADGIQDHTPKRGKGKNGQNHGVSSSTSNTSAVSKDRPKQPKKCNDSPSANTSKNKNSNSAKKNSAGDVEKVTIEELSISSSSATQNAQKQKPCKQKQPDVNQQPQIENQNQQNKKKNSKSAKKNNDGDVEKVALPQGENDEVNIKELSISSSGATQNAQKQKPYKQKQQDVNQQPQIENQNQQSKKKNSKSAKKNNDGDVEKAALPQGENYEENIEELSISSSSATQNAQKQKPCKQKQQDVNQQPQIQNQNQQSKKKNSKSAKKNNDGDVEKAALPQGENDEVNIEELSISSSGATQNAQKQKPYKQKQQDVNQQPQIENQNQQSKKKNSKSAKKNNDGDVEKAALPQCENDEVNIEELSISSSSATQNVQKQKPCKQKQQDVNQKPQIENQNRKSKNKNSKSAKKNNAGDVEKVALPQGENDEVNIEELNISSSSATQNAQKQKPCKQEQQEVNQKPQKGNQNQQSKNQNQQNGNQDKAHKHNQEYTNQLVELYGPSPPSSCGQNTWMYLGRLKPGTTEHDIKNYLLQKFPKYEFTVESLPSHKNAKLTCFKVQVDNTLLEDFQNQENWPEGVKIIKFIENFKSRK